MKSGFTFRITSFWRVISEAQSLPTEFLRTTAPPLPHQLIGRPHSPVKGKVGERRSMSTDQPCQKYTDTAPDERTYTDEDRSYRDHGKKNPDYYSWLSEKPFSP